MCEGYTSKMTRILMCAIVVVLITQGISVTSLNATAVTVKPTMNATAVTVKPTMNATAVTVKPTVNATDVTVKPTVNATAITVKPTMNATAVTVKPTVNATDVTVKPKMNATAVTVKPTMNATAVTVKPTMNTTAVTVKPTMNATAVTVKPTMNATAVTVKPKMNATAVTVKPTMNATAVTVKPTMNATTVTVKPKMNATAITVKPTMNATAVTVKPTVNATDVTVKPKMNATAVTIKPTVNATAVTVKPTMNTTVVSVKPTVNATAVTIKPTVNTTAIAVKPTVNATAVTVKPTVNTKAIAVKPTVNATAINVTRTVNTTAIAVKPTVNATAVTVKPTVNATAVTIKPTVNATAITVKPTMNTTATNVTRTVNTTAIAVKPTVNATATNVTRTVNTTAIAVKPTVNATAINVTRTVNTTAIAVKPTVNATATNVTRTLSRMAATMRPTVNTTSITVKPTVITTGITATPTMKTTIVSTTPVTTIAPVLENRTFYVYEMSMKVTQIKEPEDEEPTQTFKILFELINSCKPDKIKSTSVYFITFQTYLKGQICGIQSFQELKDCALTITDLKCGSLNTKYNLVLGVQGTDSIGVSKNEAGNVVKAEIEDGTLGQFSVDKMSLKWISKQGTGPEPTKDPPQATPNVYVIVTMDYTWRDFCGAVKKHFRERIAERSYVVEKRLKPYQIVILNDEKPCEGLDDKNEDIDVWFVVLGSDEATIQIGNDLRDLLETRQLRKLGNLFEDRITAVEFGGKNAPQTSDSSDTKRIWVAVSVTLAVLLVLLIAYLWCTRDRRSKDKTERGPDYFAMDNLDGSKDHTVLVNEGFDEQGGTHTPLVHRVSTFKHVPEEEEPLTKTETPGLETSPEGDEKKAPLGEGEDSTDDELGMTVADVAIEPQKGDKKTGATPPGTLPIIPPDPAHMAIQGLGSFADDTGGQAKRDKEYEDLDQAKTDPKAYPGNTLDKNRTANLVPKPETRVKLSPDNDYINASFVKDHHGVESFIATQHPLSNTMRDFWSMVWKNDVCVVVMVNDQEKDMENFHNYWMDQKNSLTIYGHMQVKTEDTKSMDSFNITTFVLKNSQEIDVTKVVHHYRFTKWPGDGVPDVKDFLEFIRSVDKARLENPKSPLVVHCNDGQGFTGVAIAADIGLRVYQESDKKSMVNIFDCVNKMRGDREGIVSSKDLYKYIFKLLKNIVDSGSTSDSKL